MVKCLDEMLVHIIIAQFLLMSTLFFGAYGDKLPAPRKFEYLPYGQKIPCSLESLRYINHQSSKDK